MPSQSTKADTVLQQCSPVEENDRECWNPCVSCAHGLLVLIPLPRCDCTLADVPSPPLWSSNQTCTMARFWRTNCVDWSEIHAFFFGLRCLSKHSVAAVRMYPRSHRRGADNNTTTANKPTKTAIVFFSTTLMEQMILRGVLCRDAHALRPTPEEVWGRYLGCVEQEPETDGHQSQFL